MNATFEPIQGGDCFLITLPYHEKKIGEMSKDIIFGGWRVKLYGVFSFNVNDLGEARKKISSFLIV
jgi:hypothetical protein